MAEFEKSIGTILLHEGGLVNNPNDPGGTTNFGISLRWALGQMKTAGVQEFDVDGDGDVDADDIIKMPATKAVELYRKYFWLSSYELLPQDLATKVFDMSVNMGATRAHIIVANALTALTEEIDDFEGINIDQVCARIEVYDEAAALSCIRMGQWGWYDLLINRNAALLKNGVKVPDFSVFRKGWRKRAFS